MAAKSEASTTPLRLKTPLFGSPRFQISPPWTPLTGYMVGPSLRPATLMGKDKVTD